MKEHTMRLRQEPFQAIKEGRKTIELRLYDEKRRKISVGDVITFINEDNPNDSLVVYVKNLFVFQSFDELYNNLPLLKCGYTEKDLCSASPSDMELYYSKEEQNQYSVVGIEIAFK